MTASELVAKGRPMTASELVAVLSADPEFVAREARKEAQRLVHVARMREAEMPLIEELASAGYVVDSAWDLVNTTASYPDALPVLFRHLQRPYPEPIRAGIVRAMGVREANWAWDTIAALYNEEPPGEVKDGMAAALSGSAGDAELGKLIDLVSNASHGQSRILLLRALRRSRDPRAHAKLLELRDDPQLKDEIAFILRELERQAAKRAARKPANKKSAARKPAPPAPTATKPVAKKR